MGNSRDFIRFWKPVGTYCISHILTGNGRNRPFSVCCGLFILRSMRPTLLRLFLDRPWVIWDTDPLTGLPGVGLCWVWILLAVASVALSYVFRWLARSPLATGAPGETITTGTAPTPSASPPPSNYALWLSDLGFWGLGLLAITLMAPTVARWMSTSEHPVNSLPLFGYGFMVLLGVLAAIAVAQVRGKRVGITTDMISDFSVWMVFSGIAGGRLLFLLQYPHEVYDKTETFLGRLQATVNLSNGGLVLIGALTGGALGFFAFCARRNLKPLAFADLYITSVFIGVGFGRLGCLLNGCCFGEPTNLPWAIRFSNPSIPFNTLVQQGLLLPTETCTMPLHPTQIYGSLDGFFLAAVTWFLYGFRHRSGEVFAAGCILCAIDRFLLEFLRADEQGQFGTKLTISQFYSLAIATAATLLWMSIRRKRAT